MRSSSQEARPRRRLCAGAAVSLALLLATAGGAGAVPSNAPDPGAYVTDGPVRALARAGGRTYVGGDFTLVGRRSGSGALLSAAGAPQPFPEVAGGDVHAAVSDGAGGWYVGGTFTAVGGQRRLGLAHVGGDGSVDPAFSPVVTDSGGRPATVDALALSRPLANGSRVLYVGGEFFRIGRGDGQIRRNVAALDAGNGKTSNDVNIVADCLRSANPSCSPAVHALALTYVSLPVTDPVTGATQDQPQPVLFVGGEFRLIGPEAQPSAVDGLAAIWGVGSVDATSFSNAGELVSGPPNGDATPVWAPEITPNSVNGVAVYALQVGGMGQSATQPAFPVYVAGRRRATDVATAPVTPMVRAYQLQVTNRNNRTVATGDVLYKDGATDTNRWTPQPAGCESCAARALALSGSYLYFGGDFTKVGATGADAGRLGRIKQIAYPDSRDSPLNRDNGVVLGAGVEASVRALVPSATSATVLVAGGDFGQRALALDGTSGAPLPAWKSPAPDTSVRALAVDPSTPSIFAGGDFRALGAVPRAGLAAFDSAGSLLDWAPTVTSDDPGDPPRIDVLAASGGAVYLGGRFDRVNGQPRANLAAADAASGGVTSFASDVTLTNDKAGVLSLSPLGSTLYVGGAFDRVGGQPRANLAAVDAATGAVSGWDPGVEGREVGLEPAVRAIAPACGAVYVGGEFERVGGQPRRNLAAVDPASGAATPWDPDPDGEVFALARSGPTIYAGGTFTSVRGASRAKVAGLDATDGSATAFNAGIKTVGAYVRTLAVSDSAVYLGGVFESLRDRLRHNLGSADPATGEPTDWDPSADGPVGALALGDGGVYAGGSFESLGATAQRGFAPFGAGAGSPFVSTSCASAKLASESGSNPPAPGPAPAPAPDAAPAVPSPASTSTPAERLTVSPSRVSLRGGVPLSVRFLLSRPMTVRLRFERRQRGRYARFAAVTRRGRRGPNRLSFPSLRVGGRKLVPGRYRVTLVAAPDASRVTAARRIAYFRVVGR